MFDSFIHIYCNFFEVFKYIYFVLQIKFLPDDTNIAQYLSLRGSAFSTIDAPINVYIVFGLKEQDLSPCHRTDSLCFGSTVWDHSMDLNNKDSQIALMVNTCFAL